MNSDLVRGRMWGSACGALLGALGLPLVYWSMGRPAEEFSSVLVVIAVILGGQIGRGIGEAWAVRGAGPDREPCESHRV